MVELAELDDYNKAFNKNLSLADDEIYFMPSTGKISKDTFNIEGLQYKIVGRDTSDFFGTDVIRSYRAVVKDLKKVDEYGKSLDAQISITAGWGFNTDLSDEQIIENAN